MVRSVDKRVINGNSDVNQLVPIVHSWAWDKYLSQNANNWFPQEVAMGRDIELWKSSKLSDAERLVIKRNLGFFTTADSLAANNIVLGTYKHITSPECRQFLLRQAFDEAIHTHAYQYIVQSLGLDEEEIFGSYLTVPCIREKDDFLIPFIQRLCDPHFKTGTPKDDTKFFESLFVFACIMEGLFFYVGFAQILSMGRQNKMTGTAEQYQYIMRDESAHCNFGIDMMNTIKLENPSIWTGELQNTLVALMKIGVYLESQYAIDTMPTGFLGLNSSIYTEYVKFIADRRLYQIGLGHKSPWSGSENPFPWMSEMIDLKKEKNFFETRVTEYQVGGALSWD
jgi:ribonucleoside-diphosphate reductase beta chain